MKDEVGLLGKWVVNEIGGSVFEGEDRCRVEVVEGGIEM